MMRFVPSWEIPTEAEKEYSLFVTDIDNESYRMEFTEVGNFKMNMADSAKSSFEFKLPPTPNTIYMACYFFFKHISDRYNTEAALQLFYNREANQYFLSVPTQYVSYASVDYERDYMLEMKYLLVADIHSHGKIPAFFSSIDDADELGTRLFIVFGDFRRSWTAKIRAGSGGHFCSLHQDDVFDVMDELSMSQVNQLVDELMTEIHKINF